MYCIPSMITNLGLGKGKDWPSDVHRIVSENSLLANPRITTRDHLMASVAWINDQDEKFLKTATIGNLVDAGFPGI